MHRDRKKTKRGISLEEKKEIILRKKTCLKGRNTFKKIKS